MSSLIKSKKEKAQALLKNQEILRCPHCKEPMRVDGFTLGCINRHLFDISKKGYVNVATSKGDDQYNHLLFNARKTMIHAGLFAPIQSAIAAIIQHTHNKPNSRRLLDAGCGEGAFLSRLMDDLNDFPMHYYGIDLSKEAIALATNEQASIAWLVGDLKNIPFLDHTMDVILNVFSLASYAEFKRILQPDGYLIKVIPKDYHFSEVRELYYPNNHYSSNSQAIKQALKKHATIKQCLPLRYTFLLSGNQKRHITSMSPLSKNKEKDIELSSDFITIDVEIIVAKFI